MNQIANICDLVDVDVKAVGQGIGLDHRIGTQFMNPGIGYGGSCFPKDVRSLESLAAGRRYDAELLKAVEHTNDRQIDVALAKIVAALGGNAAGKAVAVLGVAFKPNTDDIRGAPVLELIERLLAAERRFALTIRSRWMPRVRDSAIGSATATRCTRCSPAPTRCCWRPNGTNTRTSTLPSCAS